MSSFILLFLLGSFCSAFNGLPEEGILDSNRSVMIDGERIFVPKKLPKLGGDGRWALLAKAGIDPSLRFRSKAHKRRRSLLKPWKIERTEKKAEFRPLIAVDPHLCPKYFDAITEAKNHRTYIFSGPYVYQIWRDDGLQQKAAFKIGELFPDGPSKVNAAMTNLRSGVTILIHNRKVFRFRWNKAEQRFYQTRKSPVDLNQNITFVPKLAYQWKDGHIILSDGKKFVTYDPYWNVATFSGTIADYFPNVPSDAIGLAHNSRFTYLLLTSGNTQLSDNQVFLQIYDMRKFKVVQEYPISTNNFVACLSKL